MSQRLHGEVQAAFKRALKVVGNARDPLRIIEQQSNENCRPANERTCVRQKVQQYVGVVREKPGGFPLAWKVCLAIRIIQSRVHDIRLSSRPVQMLQVTRARLLVERAKRCLGENIYTLGGTQSSESTARRIAGFRDCRGN